MRAGRDDMSEEDLVKQYEKQYASGEINLNGNAKDFLRNNFGANLVRDGESGGGDGGSDDGGGGDTGGGDTGGGNGGGTGGGGGADQEIGYGDATDGMTQNVNQDNDIISNVTGNNNTVTNTQDNSVKQYGAWGSKTADRAKALRDRYVADVSRFARID